jgi:hypothetical protein
MAEADALALAAIARRDLKAARADALVIAIEALLPPPASP